jgi:hypothetical protein
MMALTRTRTGFRRLALLIAAAQVVAYATAPAIEAMSERAPGPNAIESAHGRTCAPIHQPAACMACQLLNLTARKSDGGPRFATIESRAMPIAAAATPAAPRAPPRSNLTRAPPPSLA